MWPSNEAKLPSPWDRFLEELDGLLREQVHVHCIGGFVVSLFYGLPREHPRHCLSSIPAGDQYSSRGQRPRNTCLPQGPTLKGSY
jgi:hypothetical protein